MVQNQPDRHSEIEERYRRLTETAFGGIAFTRDLKMIEVNERLATMFGYERSELIGREVMDLVAPESRELVERTIGSGVDEPYEHLALKKDGTVFPVEVRGTSYVIGGNRERVTEIRDISQRRSAEEALRSSEVKFATAFHSSPDAVIISAVTDGTLIEVNEGFELLSGYPRAEAIGKTSAELNLWAAAGDRAELAGALNERGVVRGLEMDFRSRSGEIIPCLLSAELIELDGQQCILTVTRDIRDLVRAMEEVRQSERRYRALIEGVRDAIFTLSADGMITSLNAAFEHITGWRQGDWIGKSFLDLLHPEERERALRVFRDALISESTPMYEFRILCQNGDYVVGEFTASRQIVDGQVTGLLGIARDITERLELEEQLRQSQKLESIGTLAGGIAHDFNNIMGIVLAHTEMLKRGAPDPDAMERGVEAISQSVQRGTELVRQLLTFARKDEPRLERFGINVAVHEIETLARTTFPKTIQLACHLAEELPDVLVDAGQIHQVLLNLCVNARDAMSGQGTISIRTGSVSVDAIRRKYPDAEAEAYATVEVSDTGVGMDETTLHRVFEPFFTTKGAGKGTGLGLAVAYGIVTEHSGFIDAESSPGVGTTFRVYLPAAGATDRPSEPEGTPGGEPSPGSGTILFVEDEAEIASLIQEFLEEYGYEVLRAADGEEAIDLYETRWSSINLVITDIGLPKISGEEVFRRMQTINPEAAILLASGYLDPAVRESLLIAGAKGFVQKPYTPAAVLAEVQKIFEQP
jgi:PAS domain S-box-containing protein